MWAGRKIAQLLGCPVSFRAGTGQSPSHERPVFSLQLSRRKAPVRRHSRSYQLRSGREAGPNCQVNTQPTLAERDSYVAQAVLHMRALRAPERLSAALRAQRVGITSPVAAPVWARLRASGGASYGFAGRRLELCAVRGVDRRSSPSLPRHARYRSALLRRGHGRPSPLVSTRISHRPSDGDFPQQRNHSALVSGRPAGERTRGHPAQARPSVPALEGLSGALGDLDVEAGRRARHDPHTV